MGLSRVGYPLLVVIFVVTFLSFCAMIGGLLVLRSERLRLRRGEQVEQKVGATILSIATIVFFISFLLLVFLLSMLSAIALSD